MDISSVNSDLIRGNVTTIILGCLKDTDKYGYEILKEIEDKSHSQYALKQATLYNQLKRLEKQGLVRSYDGAPDDTGGGKRRYYALTPEGLAYLKKEKGEYEYARTILDKLVSESEFDFTQQIPFDASELRPYSKRDGSDEKPKVVYKDKIVEVEKAVEVEKKVYIDRFGNPLTEEEYEQMTRQALLEDEEARKTEEELANALAKLRESEDAKIAYEEQLKLAEQDRIEKEQQLALAEEAKKERDEQLRIAEEERTAKEVQLRQVEEERTSTEEQLRLAKEEKQAAYDELERLRNEQLAEEERKRAEQTKPSTTVDELFAKLEAQSEYSTSTEERPTQLYAEVPEDGQVYFEHREQQTQQTTLQELFRQLDERAAQLEDERKRVEQEQEQQRKQEEELKRQQEEYERYQAEVAADLAAAQHAEQFAESEIETDGNQDTYGATSAVVPQAENGFEFERNHVNYRDFFASIADYPEPEEAHEEAKPQQSFSDGDIKTRLYAKGFKIRPYDRGNTSEYYTFNFIQSNRINRDTFLIVLALFLIEIAVTWVSLLNRISYTYFLPITLVGAALCLIPTVIYFINPTRRIRANFNFKLSILNRTMLFIELTLVCVLVGFFALGASVNDIDLILCSMVIPAVLLLNLPISSLIYWLLYRTRKYHIA